MHTFGHDIFPALHPQIPFVGDPVLHAFSSHLGLQLPSDVTASSEHKIDSDETAVTWLDGWMDAEMTRGRLNHLRVINHIGNETVLLHRMGQVPPDHGKQIA